MTTTYSKNTREVSLTQNTWTKVLNGPCDWPVVFTANDTYTWAISLDEPTITGFPGTANVLVQLPHNTVTSDLWMKTSGSSKKCTITGGNTVTVS
jgi:hypothetical protein